MTPQRNLVIVYRPGWQAIEDFIAIKNRISAKAPDIEVFIVNNRLRSQLEELISRRPTFVFAPADLGAFIPQRGRVYHGRPIAKDIQQEKLSRLGLPVPRTALLAPGIRPDPAFWGPFVIIKPASAKSARGQGISICPTHLLKHHRPEDYPEGHPGRTSPMLVQSFIGTGPHARHYRVNTLFGKVLYCLLNEQCAAMPELETLAGERLSPEAATNSREHNARRLKLVSDPDVLDLARRCHAAFADVPLKGVDIIREASSGKLYVLELNCTSNTWHISSNYFAPYRRGGLTREAMASQFGAFDVAADTLISRCRWEAV